MNIYLSVYPKPILSQQRLYLYIIVKYWTLLKFYLSYYRVIKKRVLQTLLKFYKTLNLFLTFYGVDIEDQSFLPVTAAPIELGIVDE